MTPSQPPPPPSYPHGRHLTFFMSLDARPNIQVKRVLLLTQIKLLGAKKVTSYYVLGWACALTLPQLLIAVISMASDPLVKTEVSF
jgi:hypothetical protein